MKPPSKARDYAHKLLEAVDRELERSTYGKRTDIQKELKISANKFPRAIERGNIDLVTLLGFVESLHLDAAALFKAVLAAEQGKRSKDHKSIGIEELGEIDRLDFLYQDNDPTAESEIIRALKTSEEEASICGVAGSLYFVMGAHHEARRFFHKATDGAKEGWRLAEVMGRRVNMAVADGELSYARSLAEHGYLMAQPESSEVAGRLVHQVAYTHYHLGNYSKARHFYRECLDLVSSSSFHWSSARIALAILAMKEKDLPVAQQHLAAIEGARLPATLTAYWCAVMADLAAKRGEYSEAADWQRAATANFGSHRLADIGVSTALTVGHLLKSGRSEEARRVAIDATHLVQRCRKANQAIASALAELVTAGLEAELSGSKAQACVARIRQANRRAQEHHMSDHCSALRQK